MAVSPVLHLAILATVRYAATVVTAPSLPSTADSAHVSFSAQEKNVSRGHYTKLWVLSETSQRQTVIVCAQMTKTYIYTCGVYAREKEFQLVKMDLEKKNTLVRPNRDKGKTRDASLRRNAKE